MRGFELPSRGRLAVVAIVTGATSLTAVAWAVAAATAPATTLVSVNTAGTGAANAASVAPSISANGRYVAFHSRATDVSPDAGAVDNVYVRDLKSSSTRLVSRSAAGVAGSAPSRSPSLSGSGRFVAFESGDDGLAASDANGRSDVLVADLRDGTIRLASVNGAGTASGNMQSYGASMSGNGRFVAFTSRADDLAAGDGNGTEDVFVRDMKARTTVLVSANAAGTASGDGASQYPKISANGRFVGFASLSTDLVANDGNAKRDVFLRDLKSGTTKLVSVNASGTGSADGASGDASVSANGRFVAFDSNAVDLVAGKTTATYDIFVRDMKAGTTRLVSVNAAGVGGGNGESFNPAISADGRYVLFVSRASDIVANDANGTMGDIFVRDLKTGTTTLVSVNSAGTGVGDAASGSYGYPYLSSNGRMAVFDSRATDLAPNDGNAADDVFVRVLR